MNYYNEHDKNVAAWIEDLVANGDLPPGIVDSRGVQDIGARDILNQYDQCHFFAGIGGWPHALDLAGWPRDRPIWSASLPCFPAGTSVITDAGVVPIEEIRSGDKVLTHEQRFRKVTATGSRVADCVTVKGQGHWGLVCTENHPFLSRGTRRDCRRKSPTYGKTVLNDDVDWRPASTLESYRWALPTRVPEVAMPPFPAPHWRGKPANLPRDPVSPAFARLLGFWIGNGWSNKDGLIICDGYEDVALMEEILDATGLSYCLSEQRTSVRALIGSQILRQWVPGQFGKGAHLKTLPTWLLGAPLPFIEAFIQGWFDADGHHEVQPRGGACVKAWTTTSPRLAVGLRLLLSRCGRAASISFHKPTRELIIEGRRCNERGFYRVRTQEHARSFKFSDGLGWGKVHSVKPSGRHRVYNLAVEEDESYTADGVIVHNCQPFSDAGKQLGVEDERHLWPVFRDLVAHYRPERIVGEQVASKAGRAWFAALQLEMEELGYWCGAIDLCAAGFGAPHIRQRLFWCAVRVGQPDGAGREPGRATSPTARHGGSTEPAGGVGGLPDTETRRQGEVGQIPGGCPEGGAVQGGQRPECSSGDERLANSHGERFPQRQERNGKANEPGQQAPSGHDPLRRSGYDYWDSVVYVPCSDGKARPIKSCSESMADGLPGCLVSGGDHCAPALAFPPLVSTPSEDLNDTNEARAMRLRGYGNAIVAPLAAEFIRAFMDILDDIGA